MKQKTKKRLRRLAIPFIILWAGSAVVIAATGIILKCVAFLMFGEPNLAREELNELSK